MPVKNSYNFRQISDVLTTSGVVGAGRLKGLKDEGYQAVINLLPDDSEYAVADESAIIAEQGVDYRYIPVDWFKPRSDDYQAFASVMDELTTSQARGKLHIHCAANYRVSGFLSRWMLIRQRWTATEADNFVQDLWNPAEHPQWQKLLAEITPNQD